MEDIIVPIGVIGIIFFGVVSIIRAVTDYQLRRKLIQLGHVDKEASYLLRRASDNQAASLKWGLIILFGGLGLIIISITGIESQNSALPLGVVLVSVSIGFLLYHFLRRNASQPTNWPTEKSPTDYTGGSSS